MQYFTADFFLTVTHDIKNYLYSKIILLYRKIKNISNSSNHSNNNTNQDNDGLKFVHDQSIERYF